jgi:hypothetical protein
MALAGAMIAGACSSADTTTVVTDPLDVADGATDNDTSTEFDPVDATAPTTEPSADPTAVPTTTPGPLITPTPVPSPVAPRPISTCPDTEVPQALLFVWNVADDDRDGGLVAHTDADVDSPVTRVLLPNELAMRPTGNCKPAPNGAPWFELFDAASDRFDWVNSRYLAPASPACVHGESYGSETRAGVAGSDFDTQLFGPIPGFAIAEDDIVAFLPDRDGLGDQVAPLRWFRWYQSDAVTIDVPCFLNGPPGPRCLSGTAQLFSFTDPEFRINGDTPIDVVRTGRLYAHPDQRGLRDEFVEVTIDGDPGRYWYDPAVTDASSAPCSDDGSNPIDQTGGAGFDSLTCTIGDEGTEATTIAGGSATSDADHVHDMASFIDPAGDCVRIVFAFGTDAWTDDDRASNSLPEVVITKRPTSTQILWGPCGWGPDCNVVGVGFDDPPQFNISDLGIRALSARTDDGDYAIEIIHPDAASNVTLLQNPARVLIDLAVSDGAQREWIGGGPTIAARLPFDLQADTPFSLRGWDRPFEAQGQWRVYRVDDLISFEPDTPLKLDNYAESDLDLVASGLYMTAGWSDAWGAFVADFPGLEPGIYAVLVGSTSPADGAYMAAGQVIRVHDAATDPATLPTLPPQWWDSITLSN